MTTPVESSPAECFKIWAADNMVYGPVTLEVLAEWIRDERVLPTTWVHSENRNHWVEARQIPSLRLVFESVPGTTAMLKKTDVAVGEVVDRLRPFPMFTGLSSEQLNQLARFGELLRTSDGEQILRYGDPGDGLFFLLEGKARVSIWAGSEQRTLNVIQPGQCFGEIAMFTQTPRVADVYSDGNAQVWKVSSEAFQLLIRQIPALAAPVLFSVAQVMAHRIADSNSALKKEVTSGFVWR